jgi:hypothetical protein
MTNADEEARKAYAEAGVDLPEVKEEKEETKEEPQAPPEKKPEETPPAKTEGDDKKPEDKAPLQDEPKEQRKRSIYDEYKDKKAELKSEKELREQAERERDDWKTKFEALQTAETPEEKKEAADDLEAFAKEINASPEALKKMQQLFLKDVKPAIDPELTARLKRFEDWQAQNSKVIEQANFEREYTESLPKLKTYFPNATPEEMSAIKTEIDKLAHTKEWHDKSLAYIAFEHQDKLSALITPRKRGMEGKGRSDVESSDFEFDPNPDFSKMSAKQQSEWKAEYDKALKSEGLATGANGKKIIV